MPAVQALCTFLHIGLIRPQHEEALVTLAMLHVDRARSRLPLACTAISMMVLAIFLALWFISWLLETNTSAPNLQEGTSTHVLRPNPPSMDVRDAEPPDPYETESWVRHGREF
jgi:hypothetical protein